MAAKTKAFKHVCEHCGAQFFTTPVYNRHVARHLALQRRDIEEDVQDVDFSE